ncbi:hypothetical protein QAD02_006598 [Eretmocerus hayati]|uniref:Uncharacterized protein n=1 Tax=Eretmocerus hayati TaxID=131215 RepID=A0ACC2N256_9HYME|nr:hypothetical protein QAD02_006598 [Eretmocerus hayati]
MQGISSSESSRAQIHEFDELVSRFAKINGDVSESNFSNDPKRADSSDSALERGGNFEYRKFDSVSGIGSSVGVSSCVKSGISSKKSGFSRRQYNSVDALQSQPSDLACVQSNSVRVNIGIDEDLQMILEMDPSIVDRAPLAPDQQQRLAPTPRARPQGWYIISGRY